MTPTAKADMAKAQEEIKQFGMDNAILNAQKGNDDTNQSKKENAISNTELEEVA